MHIEQHGRGPDLVMLHGWSMHSAVWSGMVDLLGERYRLHLVDLPGHGNSAWSDGDLDLDRLVDSLAQKLPERAHWLGWSLGGLVALAMAARHPQQVEKLILLAATPRFVRADDWEHAVDASVFEQFAARLDNDQRQTLQRFLMLQARGARQSRETLRELTASLARRHSPDPRALHAGLDLLLQGDLRKQLAALHCPVQLILGERDTLIPPEMALAAARLKPELVITEIAGAGHAPFISHTVQCAQLIESFIDD